MSDGSADPFARISAEAAQSPSTSPASRDDKGELVSPAPEDAPPLPETWRGPGRPVMVWTYRDAAGRILRHTLRFEDAEGGKDIRPVTLWRAADGRLKWRFGAGGDRRPLYGLDRLAARPDAAVLLSLIHI